MIELTLNDGGIWTNTTRVDSYQYAMGLEVWGGDNFYKKTGEIISHKEIIEAWRSQVSNQFQGCYNENEEVIQAPSKTPQFEIGGSQENYMRD